MLRLGRRQRRPRLGLIAQPSVLDIPRYAVERVRQLRLRLGRQPAELLRQCGQRLQLAQLQDHRLLLFAMVADPQLEDAGTLRLAGLLQVDAQAAVVVDRDEIADAGEGDLGVLLRQALGGDHQRLEHVVAAGGDGRLDPRLAQQPGRAGLGAARREAGADVSLGGVAVLEVLSDEALMARREGLSIVGHAGEFRRGAAYRRFPPLRLPCSGVPHMVHMLGAGAQRLAV